MIHPWMLMDVDPSQIIKENTEDIIKFKIQLVPYCLLGSVQLYGCRWICMYYFSISTNIVDHDDIFMNGDGCWSVIKLRRKLRIILNYKIQLVRCCYVVFWVSLALVQSIRLLCITSVVLLSWFHLYCYPVQSCPSLLL